MGHSPQFIYNHYIIRLSHSYGENILNQEYGFHLPSFS